MFDDETLRDGLQGPSSIDPPIERKIELLHLMDRLGIDTADIGLPGAGPRAVADVKRLCEEIASAGLSIKANCAARTLEADIRPCVDIVQATGVPIEVCTFIGSSPIRLYAEGWDVDRLLSTSQAAVEFAVREGLDVMFVTEDTTRAHPDVVRALYSNAIQWGAKRICVCDTVGHVTPAGVCALMSFVKDIVDESGADIGIDWHGHRDRMLSIPNSIAALESGATRVHAAATGIGERAGNTPMDMLLVNLKLMGAIENDLHALKDYVSVAADAVGVPLPQKYPVFGEDAFTTGTGVHAAAVIKALRKGDSWLADRVYSGVPAGEFGLEQRIVVGYMSGKSNAVYWLEKRGHEASEENISRIMDLAKDSDHILTDEELTAVIAH